MLGSSFATFVYYGLFYKHNNVSFPCAQSSDSHIHTSSHLLLLLVILTTKNMLKYLISLPDT